MPGESMPKGTQENKGEVEPKVSPEEKLEKLLSHAINTNNSKEIYIIRDAFKAGRKGKHEDWNKLATAADQAGDLELLGKINEAFRLGEETGPTKGKEINPASREAHEPHAVRPTEQRPNGPEAENKEVFVGALKTLENMLKGRSKEEREALIKFVMESAPDFVEEIQKKGRIEVKTVVAKFVDLFFEKIDTLPETMFKELRALKKEQPEYFTILRKDLQTALLTDDEGERNRKVDAIFNDIQIAGEVVGDIKNIMTVAAIFRETVEGKTLTPEERKKAEEMQKAGLAAAGGLWEKIWPIGGLFLSLMLIGLILTVILVLSVSDSKFGKGK